MVHPRALLVGPGDVVEEGGRLEDVHLSALGAPDALGGTPDAQDVVEPVGRVRVDIMTTRLVDPDHGPASGPGGAGTMCLPRYTPRAYTAASTRTTTAPIFHTASIHRGRG